METPSGTTRHDDLAVVDEMVKGVDLVGSVGQVPSMTSAFKPATKPVQELKETAGASRKAIFATVKGSGDAEVYHR